MIPAVVSTVITAQMTRPTVTAASQNARKREWPDQRSASAGEPGGTSVVVEGEVKCEFLTSAAGTVALALLSPPESNFASVSLVGRSCPRRSEGRSPP